MNEMNKFCDLMDDLLKRREGEELSKEVELDYEQQLDELYYTLTDSEQDFLNRKYSWRKRK